MKQITIDAYSAGKRLDKWLLREFPLLGMSMMQKYFRLKEIKINKKPAKGDARLAENDVVTLFIPDEYLQQSKPVDPFLKNFHHHLSIVYEDENILLADKKPGLMAHPDSTEHINTLLTHIHAYLYQKGEYDSKNPASFTPALCNRIDRFTGGIVIAAKNAEAMRIMNEKIRNREIDKFYLCIVNGRVNPPEGMLDSWLKKNESGRKMLVYRREVPGSQQALTAYRTLDCRDGLSLMECELLTGRTHQIRAQFASVGHPLLGDSQYGDQHFNEVNDRLYQALYAYKLTFSFKTDAGILNGLNGKTFTVWDVPFVREYFPRLNP